MKTIGFCNSKAGDFDKQKAILIDKGVLEKEATYELFNVDVSNDSSNSDIFLEESNEEVWYGGSNKKKNPRKSLAKKKGRNEVNPYFSSWSKKVQAINSTKRALGQHRKSIKITSVNYELTKRIKTRKNPKNLSLSLKQMRTKIAENTTFNKSGHIKNRNQTVVGNNRVTINTFTNTTKKIAFTPENKTGVRMPKNPVVKPEIPVPKLFFKLESKNFPNVTKFGYIQKHEKDKFAVNNKYIKQKKKHASERQHFTLNKFFSESDFDIQEELLKQKNTPHFSRPVSKTINERPASKTLQENFQNNRFNSFGHDSQRYLNRYKPMDELVNTEVSEIHPKYDDKRPNSPIFYHTQNTDRISNEYDIASSSNNEFGNTKQVPFNRTNEFNMENNHEETLGYLSDESKELIPRKPKYRTRNSIIENMSNVRKEFSKLRPYNFNVLPQKMNKSLDFAKPSYEEKLGLSKLNLQIGMKVHKQPRDLDSIFNYDHRNLTYIEKLRLQKIDKYNTNLDRKVEPFSLKHNAKVKLKCIDNLPGNSCDARFYDKLQTRKGKKKVPQKIEINEVEAFRHYYKKVIEQERISKQKYGAPEVHKFVEIFKYLPKGKIFAEKKNLYLKVKDKILKGKDQKLDLYNEFIAKLSQEDFKLIQFYKDQYKKSGNWIHEEFDDQFSMAFQYPENLVGKSIIEAFQQKHCSVIRKRRLKKLEYGESIHVNDQDRNYCNKSIVKEVDKVKKFERDLQRNYECPY